jgi:hypothetical protein
MSRDVSAIMSNSNLDSQIGESSLSIISQEIINSNTNQSKSINVFNSNTSKESIRCEKCFKYYLMEFQKDNLNKINYYCNCQKNSSESINQNSINNKSMTNSSIIFYEYFYYCSLCKQDLSKEDIKFHEDHKNKLIEFNKFHIDDDIKIIKEILLDDVINNNRNFKIMNKKHNLKEKIEMIIKEFKTATNYNLIKNIKNIINFFKIRIKSKNELIDLINKALENKDINIIDQNEENIYKESTLEEISIIDIEKSNLYNLNEFCLPQLKDKFKNLIELSLINNNIRNIEPLLNINLTSLKTLNFLMNKIGDDMIKCVEKLNLPNLKELIFDNNNFTNYDIFPAIQHFYKLELFNINSNGFTGEINKENLKNIKLNSIKQLYLNSGVFDNNSLDLLFQFKLEKIESLSLEGNNLDTLSFIKILSFICQSNWIYLEKIYLNDNNINEFYNDIPKKKNR